MAEVIRMPKMSDTMTEGVIAKWHKKTGDKISSGDLVAEIETDKATMDFESFQEGTLLYIGAKEGQTAPVDSIIAVIGAPGEDYQSALNTNTEKSASSESKPIAETKSNPESATTPNKEKNETVDLTSIDATVIRMPLLSDTMTEGVIAEWHKKVGEQVKSDDALADVETDKATMEVVGYTEGTLLYIGVEKGQAAKVNAIIAIVGKAGTDITPLLNNESNVEVSSDLKKEELTTVVYTPPKEEVSHEINARVKASPLARKIAKEKGVDLGLVKGSAEGGRIIKKDVEEYQSSPDTSSTKGVGETTGAIIPTYIGEEKFTEKPVSQMRKVIAKRLSESLFTSPHFYLTMSIDMESAMAARAKMNEFSPVKISFNDMVIKAVAVGLKQHPHVNSSWLGDKIRYNEHVNIGVAVAVEDGLLVPVVRFADGKSLSHISMEVKDFAQRAKAKKIAASRLGRIYLYHF